MSLPAANLRLNILSLFCYLMNLSSIILTTILSVFHHIHTVDLKLLPTCCKGEFSHRDDQGNEGHLKAGDIQWMKVRLGIVHEEMPIQNSCGTGFSLVGEFTIRSEIDSPKVPRCGVCTHPRGVIGCWVSARAGWQLSGF